MRLLLAILLAAAELAAQAGRGAVGGSGAAQPTSTSGWRRYSVSKVANGSNGCANANGCWIVTGSATQAAVAAAAATTQNVTLFQLPAKGFAANVRVKSSTACTGTATLTTTLGTSTNASFYVSATYDLKAAVSDTNFSTTLANSSGSTTAAAVNVVAGLASTVQNIDQTATGCAFDVYMNWATLP